MSEKTSTVRETEDGGPGASDAGFSDALVSVQIMHIDSYQMPLDHYSPAVAFQAARLNTAESPVLPTVRIFGSTPAGQKACLHLHGLRPYLFVRLPEGVPHGSAVAFSESLRTVLENALSKSVSDSAEHNAEAGEGEGGTAFGRAAGPFISDIEPTIRASIYGYHASPTIFLRISLYNPGMVRRLALLLSLRQGLEIMGCYDFQPFESNISFILQVLTDLSLTGMGYINLSSAKFRLPLPHAGENEVVGEDLAKVPSGLRLFTSSLVASRPDLFWKFGAAARRAKCDVELDAFVGDVLNPVEPLHRVHGQVGGPDGFAVKTLRILWDEERKRIGRSPTVLTEPPRSVIAGPGLSSPRLREKLESLLAGLAVHQDDAVDVEESCEDVMRYLDSNATSAPTAVETCLEAELDAGMYSDESDLDVENDRDKNEWEDIRRTQAEGLGENRHEGLNEPCTDLSPPNAPSGLVSEVLEEYSGMPVLNEDVETLEHPGEKDFVANHASVCDGGVPVRDKIRSPDKLDGLRTCPASGLRESLYVQPCGPTPVDAIARHAPSRRNLDKQGNICADDDTIAERMSPESGQLVNQRRSQIGSDEDEIFESDTGFSPDYLHQQGSRLACGKEDSLDEIMSFRSDAHDVLTARGNVALTASKTVRNRHVCIVENFSARDDAERDDAKIDVRPCRPMPSENVPVTDGERVCEIVRPSRDPPDVDMVSMGFGMGCSLPRVHNVGPFYGDPNDAPPKALTVGGREVAIGLGGLTGLRRAHDVFCEDGAAEIERDMYALVPVRRPPSLANVLADVEVVASIRRGTKSRRRELEKRTVIDSAGRQVQQNAIADMDRQDSQGLTPLSWPAKNGCNRRVRRRVDDGCDHEDDSSSSSEASGDEFSLSVGVIDHPSRALGTPLIPSVNRPASPKYDERSFFATDVVPRASARLQRLTESPVVLAKTGEGNYPSASPRTQGGRGRAAATSGCTGVTQREGLTLAVIEFVATSHSQRLPDPRKDPVLAVCIHTRDERIVRPRDRDRSRLLITQSVASKSTLKCDVTSFDDEAGLFHGIVQVFDEFDPDILLGFETQTQSIGYLLDRADTLGLPLLLALSRVVQKKFYGGGGKGMKEGVPLSDMSAGARYFQRKGADIRIPGRHVVNVWRAVRTDVKLASYSLHGVASEVLGISIPRHEPYVLEEWLASETRADRALLHLRDLTSACLAIVDKLDIVGRTGELARVYGIDFMSVLTRGSQYRVESLLARVAHQRDFVLLAAQRSQVYEQPAIECLPLVMEPESGFYHDPVVVLDFQSLYPSVIIAHNLCYSTMLGNLNRLSSWSDVQQLGVVSDYRPPSTERLRSTFGSDCKDGIYVAPNGEMFVAAKHRRGVLPQMLQEVLDTRVMIKTAMKEIASEAGNNEELLKRLNARQFAAKLLANVTYGFTSASASGRMPCAGLADAIVQGGREALEQVVRFVDDVLSPETGARVLYGDTDSLFVLVPGATKSEAFALGRRITEKAANMFPAPMKLQLEKVYMSCFMVTKKRYVGYSFDSEACVTPAFDAKGIECVRRDSCAVVQKTMEKMIRTMFETKNVSQVKRVFQRSCQRIRRGSMPLSEFIFRKEVRLGTYKELPAAAVVATRAIESDPRTAPRSGERVPFVVRYCGPKAALKECVVAPQEYLEAEAKGTSRLNSTYYISKQLVPAVARLFTLAGVNVRSWLAELPRTSHPAISTKSASTIPFYFPSWTHCIACGSRCIHELSICDSCLRSAEKLQECVHLLNLRQRRLELRRQSLAIRCLFCVGGTERDMRSISCSSLDCAVKFAKDRSALRDKRLALDQLAKYLEDV